MASVREIAKQVGLSPTTVSRALNNHPRVAPGVRKRILDAANKSRYVAAVGKRSTTNIAFCYTGQPSLGSPFDAALMDGMSQRMSELGFDLVVFEAQRARLDHESFTQMFLRKGIRGAVLRTDANTHHVCEQIAGEGFPAVLVGDRSDDEAVSYICCESRTGSREAVAYLIGLGHCRIAFCTNIVETADHADRLAGYRDALQEGGIEFDPFLVLRQPARLDGGRQAARRLLAMSPRPTAIYLADPLAAVGLLNEVQSLGHSVPGELSVVGFDDGDLRHITFPSLSAVVQNATEIGKEAFEVLQLLLDGTGPLRSVRRVLPTLFEVHKSSGMPDASRH
ncbi:MAG: LacI family DNA-binding transcriptional regulator [Phycisphaerae bacterium]